MTNLENFTADIEALIASSNGKSEVKKLEAGSYDAVIVGAITRHIKDPLTGNTRDVFELIFQIIEDDVKHYIRTKDFKLSLNEKSSYFEFLKKYLKVTSPADENFIPRLKSTGIVKDGKLTLENHFGLSVKLVLDENLAKNGKTYLQIISYGPSKAKLEITPDAIAEGLLMWDPTNQVILADGMTIKPKNQAANTASAPAPATEAANDEAKTKDNDWLDD